MLVVDLNQVGWRFELPARPRPAAVLPGEAHDQVPARRVGRDTAGDSLRFEIAVVDRLADARRRALVLFPERADGVEVAPDAGDAASEQRLARGPVVSGELAQELQVRDQRR